MSLTLRQLRYFTALADELHFSRASDLVGIAQPALSQQIRRLESLAGAELFQRDRREVRLTPAGEALLPHAVRTLAEAAAGIEAARQTAAGELGHLNIGFIETAASTIIPRAVRRFRNERSDVGLTLHEMGVNAQLEELRVGRLDVAVVRPPVDSDGLALEEIAVERLIAAFPVRHRFAARELVDPRALATEPLVALSRDVVPGLYDQILLLQQQEGGPGAITQEATSIQAVLGLVAAELGVAILPDSVRNLDREGVAFVSLRSRQRSTVIGAYRKNDPSPLVPAFLAAAKEG